MNENTYVACCYDCTWVGTQWVSISTATSEMNTHIMISTDCTSPTILDLESESV